MDVNKKETKQWEILRPPVGGLGIDWAEKVSKQEILFNQKIYFQFEIVIDCFIPQVIEKRT